MRRSGSLYVGAMLCLLAGCSSLAPIQQDQPLLLAKGDGLAAVQFDPQDPMTNIQVMPAASGGVPLTIPSAPVGKSLFLFEVPAGRYCLQKFNFGGRMSVYPKEANSNCFVVPAGKVGFSGYYRPEADSGDVLVHQDLSEDEGEAQLQQLYPTIAAQFLQPVPPAAVPAPAKAEQHPVNANEQLSAWVDQQRSPPVDTVYVRNNTQWSMKITLFELYACANIKQECKPFDPKFHLAPHETRKFMDVEPGDPLGAYAYRYHFEYGFEVNTPPKKP